MIYSFFFKLNKLKCIMNLEKNEHLLSKNNKEEIILLLLKYCPNSINSETTNAVEINLNKIPNNILMKIEDIIDSRLIQLNTFYQQ